MFPYQPPLPLLGGYLYRAEPAFKKYRRSAVGSRRTRFESLHHRVTHNTLSRLHFTFQNSKQVINAAHLDDLTMNVEIAIRRHLYTSRNDIYRLLKRSITHAYSPSQIPPHISVSRYHLRSHAASTNPFNLCGIYALQQYNIDLRMRI